MKEISGDKPLGFLQKIYYLAFNFSRGLLGQFCIFDTKFWYPTDLIISTDSPGRHFMDAFMRNYFENIELGSEIKVLDIGCGRGYIRSLLSDAGFSGNYTGLDIKKHRDFDKFLNENFDTVFVESKIEDFDTSECFDLVVSNTALEHIKDDKLATDMSIGLARKGGRVLHLVPSFWSLFLYLFHGYRQYSRCDIKRLFQGKDVRVYRLGGLFSFFLHFFYITFLERTCQFKKIRSFQIYKKSLYLAWKLDKFAPLFSYMYAIEYERK